MDNAYPAPTALSLQPTTAMTAFCASPAMIPAQRSPQQVASRSGVSERELQVLQWLAKGDTAVAIGRRLQISPATVRKHLQNLYRKLETGDRLQAVSIAYREGLIPDR